MFQFRILSASDEPCILLPENLAITMGRGEQCDVQLKDASVSRIHCRLIAVEDRVRIQDLGSRWGTFVNGTRVEHCELRPGDQVRIGETVLLLSTDSAPDQRTLARPSELARPEQLRDEPRLPNPLTGRLAGRVEQEPPKHELKSPLLGKDRPGMDGLPLNVSDQPEDVLLNQARRVSPEAFCGQRFGVFQVLTVEEESQSGFVFKAIALKSGQHVDLEILHPGSIVSRDHCRLFFESGRIASTLRHSSIVPVRECSVWSGWPYIVREPITAYSVPQLIRRSGIAGMLSEDRVLRIAMDLCDVLQYLERLGLLHRKVQPRSLVIRASDDVAMLCNMTSVVPVNGSSMTSPAMHEMSPEDVGYFAPEQLGSGFVCDRRSDLYQLGVTMYELLAGRPPFDGGTVNSLVEAVQTHEPASLRTKNMSVSPAIDAIVMKLLRKNPRDRFSSANDLKAALENVLADMIQHRVPAISANPDATGWRGALKDPLP